VALAARRTAVELRAAAHGAETDWRREIDMDLLWEPVIIRLHVLIFLW
jgi:hypothetical protein